MARDQRERAAEQLRVIGLVNPATRTRWMRQRDGDRAATRMLDLVLPADHLFERIRAEELVDRETTHRNQQRWSNDPELRSQPIRTVRALHGTRHPISSAALTWPGIAARDGRDV